MPAAMAPEVLADPIDVIVDLVVGHEPLLDRAKVAAVVEGLAGGRAKRRRLAQALLGKPTVLADGRSPAPRVIADLLIALRKAGATRISPPVCAECGKQLRTFHRRGEDWYCAVCGPRREPCVACGQVRRVSCRDRDGQPRCAQCPPGDGRDPMDVVVGIVTDIDPMMTVDVVMSAVNAAAPQLGRRHQLAWALQDRPDLLTGAGAHAPVPSVLRLIDQLCDAGSTRIARPGCSRCGRVVRLTKAHDGKRICRTCYAHLNVEQCAGCGAIQQTATRDEQGRPLCPRCLITDPANQEACADCGHRRPVSVRTPSGPLCENCRPWKTLTCTVCGDRAPCLISKTTGKPWCRTCRKRWGRCMKCNEIRPIRGGTLDKPLCATCTQPDPSFWRSCPNCGQQGRIQSGPCARCAVQQRLRDLFSDDHGEIRPELQTLYQALATTERPSTVAGWLTKSAAPAILRSLAGQELTLESLDALPAGKPVEHLRSVLVAIGTLPPRDEQMARLERWITHAVAERANPEEQQLLRRYAIWHLLRRLRHRVDGAETTHNQLVGTRQHVRGAIALLDWVAAHDLTLDTCQQPDLDAWLTEGKATHRREAGHFIRWAKKQKLTTLDFPAIKWDGPQRALDTEARWEQARWLLHDATVKPEDRVAGLLVLLYAQWPSAVSRLTLDHVQATDNEVRLRLGPEPVVLPEPLASLVLELVATRHGHATIGDHGATSWLFPGGQPGRPLSAFQLAERLRQLGILTGQSRSAALFQLATDLPAALLARMLGIHISVAVAWQRASSGDWAAYAAEVSRRNPH